MNVNLMPGPENSGHRILVVDDEPLIRETVKRVLVSEGHAVETASSGKEALALFEEDKFDLLILDYEMPDMRGDELALLIKALVPNQPIAILTGYQETVARNLLTDVDFIMSKPFDPQTLRRVTNRLFAKA
jgi:two-component system, cell cycle sensor histidine kinase and response regulator CckA